MDRWSIAVNGYFGSASIIRQRAPWWNFFLQWFVFRVGGLVPCWRLPRWITERESEYEGERYTFGEWHGTRLCQMAWTFEQPVSDWCYRRRRIVHFEMAFEDVLKSLGDQVEPWILKSWEEGAQMWQDSGPPNAEHGRVWRSDPRVNPAARMET